MHDAIARTDEMMASLGLEIYRVGGSVRDEIMGRPPKDADYMVRGVSLDELGKTLWAKGVKFKWLTDRANRPLGVRLVKGGVEITLPRKEISTGPGHRDFDIVLDPDLGIAEDAKRRDFTFNALYKHLTSGEIGDPTAAGLYDIQHKLVRTTHPDSFRDDPLRTLRALRFVSTLGYDLTADTLEQMAAHADAVDGLTTTKERVQTHTEKLADGSTLSRKRIPGDTGAKAAASGTVYDEMSRILMGDGAAKALRVAASTGVLGTLFPELAPMIGFDQGSKYHDMTTDEHTFKALETAAKVDAPLRVRWALLFHDAGKPETAWRGKDGRLHYYSKKLSAFETKLGQPTHMMVVESAPKPEPIVTEDHEVVGERLWRAAAMRMNVPRDLREDVARLVRDHMVPCSSKIKRAKIARMRVVYGDEFLSDLFLHRMCDLTGKGKANKQHMVNIAQAEVLRREMVEHDVPRTAKDLAVNGGDAKALGLAGKAIGEALAAVLDEVAVDPSAAKTGRDWQMMRLEALA